MTTFCPACGNSMDTADQFCRVCGREMPRQGVAVGGATQAIATGPQQTSTKAVISLVSGLFIFFFPLSIVAIIFGHLSLSEIKKSAGKLTGGGMAIAGLVLGYAGVAGIPLILIIAAIAIPNVLRARMAANESSAVASIRTLNTAESSYAQTHADAGYTCSLSDLVAAGLIDERLGSGQKTGYWFQVKGCDSETPGSAHTRYRVVTYPLVSNQTGRRAFCSDESAVIKVDSSGSGQLCLKSGSPLE